MQSPIEGESRTYCNTREPPRVRESGTVTVETMRCLCDAGALTPKVIHWRPS